MEISDIQIKIPVNIARIVISATKGEADGKKSILQKIKYKNHVRAGRKQKEMNQKKQNRKENSITKKERL